MILDGGAYFGSLYRPKYRGSRGGNGLNWESGKGGGYVDLQISSHLLVDGTISADGSHAKTDGSGNTDAAGGSGGTIYIRFGLHLLSLKKILFSQEPICPYC